MKNTSSHIVDTTEIISVLKKGVITFYFLFDKKNMRISPPLTIKEDEIMKACQIITQTLDKH